MVLSPSTARRRSFFQLYSAELLGQLIALGYKNVRINEALLFQCGQHLILTGKIGYLFVKFNDIQAPEHPAVADGLSEVVIPIRMGSPWCLSL